MARAVLAGGGSNARSRRPEGIGSRSSTSRTTTNIPIYVHAKVCIVDDVWMAVGSDNLNRRSWTHDSEICCGVIDLEGRLRTRDASAPRSRAPRRRPTCPTMRSSTRSGGSTRSERAARALDTWYERGRAGRPSARAPPAATRATGSHAPARPFLHFLHAWLLDPDGRPPRSASCRALLTRPRRSSARSAISTGAPNRRSRPPNAIEHNANHAHPSASPPMTSENQCTSSRTREHATATPIATAPPTSARVRASAACATHQQRDRGPERRRGRRVTARERRAEEVRGRVQRRAGPVEDLLDAVGEQALTDQDDGEERRDPAARHPAVLDDEHDDRGDDHELGRSELRDHLQDVVREPGRVVVRPLRDVVVDRDDPRAAAHEHRERAEEEARRGSSPRARP